MSRPMLLMNKNLLVDCYQLYSTGVPISKILKSINVGITQPTLTKMLKHYKAYASEDILPVAKQLIAASLFPEWLNDKDAVQVQPPEWYYSGTFPLGHWNKRV